jgi:hypothetical protein
MVRMTLWTKFDEPVTVVQLPPFNPPADVVMWGERIFVWHDDESKYIEGLLFVIPAPVEHPPV